MASQNLISEIQGVNEVEHTVVGFFFFAFLHNTVTDTNSKEAPSSVSSSGNIPEQSRRQNRKDSNTSGGISKRMVNGDYWRIPIKILSVAAPPLNKQQTKKFLRFGKLRDRYRYALLNRDIKLLVPDLIEAYYGVNCLLNLIIRETCLSPITNADAFYSIRESNRKRMHNRIESGKGERQEKLRRNGNESQRTN
ncbi:hypothetical protein TcasGA2_TC008944 [Tribolium castaneum]|uniref:Uncharacterized protein n=1 Tax=Tribolium castaneum TaxID=7070 RepID=D6WQB0_TRICA|nr:hypothetical protein TcasGA2_TC008944 [Tribolium castaneum]